MSVLGVQTIVYGVDDLDACTRFYDDFGLQALRRDQRGADFGLAEGSRVLLRRSDDPELPPAFAAGPGAREIIWGVDSAASLEALRTTWWPIAR
jgi:catechol 2,3-dioxygenase-like lactoylglutathione lyase family enzyme